MPQHQIWQMLQCAHTKLGMGKCAILRIPCACVACTSMRDKAWISGIPSEKQERYKPVTKCTYWPVLGELNNWNIIELSSKSTSSEKFDDNSIMSQLLNAPNNGQ